MTQDPYDLLQIDKNTTQDDLEKAYKKAARKFHPDAGGTKEQFQELEQAYEYLKQELEGLDGKIEKEFVNMIKCCPNADILASIKHKVESEHPGILAMIDQEQFALRSNKQQRQSTLENQSEFIFIDTVIKEYDDRIERIEEKIATLKKALEVSEGLIKLVQGIKRNKPTRESYERKMVSKYGSRVKYTQ